MGHLLGPGTNSLIWPSEGGKMVQGDFFDFTSNWVHIHQGKTKLSCSQVWRHAKRQKGPHSPFLPKSWGVMSQTKWLSTPPENLSSRDRFGDCVNYFSKQRVRKRESVRSDFWKRSRMATTQKQAVRAHDLGWITWGARSGIAVTSLHDITGPVHKGFLTKGPLTDRSNGPIGEKCFWTLDWRRVRPSVLKKKSWPVDLPVRRFCPVSVE